MIFYPMMVKRHIFTQSGFGYFKIFIYFCTRFTKCKLRGVRRGRAEIKPSNLIRVMPA